MQESTLCTDEGMFEEVRALGDHHSDATALSPCTIVVQPYDDGLSDYSVSIILSSQCILVDASIPTREIVRCDAQQATMVSPRPIS